MELIGLGFLTALGIYIILWKINIEFFARFHWQTDIAVSIGLAMLFYGTFVGVMTAVIAGIFISIFLLITRKFRGYY